MEVASQAASSCMTVFVDTDLGTHLALSVSGSYTIADLKKKILLEHPICFPKVGEIEIHAVKVKRRGCFYHLPDSMYMINVFSAVAKSWYIYVDASALLDRSEKLHCNSNSDKQLVCFNVTDDPSADAVSDGPSRCLANLNGSSLSEIEHSPCMNQEVPVTERLCSGDLSRESKEVLVTEVGHTTDKHCRTASLDSSKKPDLETSDKLELQGKDHVLPYKQTECIVVGTMNRISGTQCNNILLGESTAIKLTEKKNKTRRHRKKREDAVDDLVLNEKDPLAGSPSKDILQQEVVRASYVDNADKNVAHDASKEEANVVQETCRNSSSGARKQLVSGVHKTNNIPKGNETSGLQAEGNNDKLENVVVDVQPNNLLGGISEHRSPAKKKRKRLGSGVQKTGDLIEEVEVSVKHVDIKNGKSENEIVDVQCNNLLGDVAISVHSSPAKKKRKVEKNNSNQEAIKGMPTPEQSLGEKHKSKKATSGLGAKSTEDIHSLQTSSSAGRKKKKSKLTAPLELVAPILSPVTVSRQETTKVVEIKQKDSEEPNATSVGKSELGETITIVNSIGFGEKHDGPVEVEKVNVLGSLDVDMSDANALNVRAETDVPEELEEPVKEMDTSRSGHVDVKNWPLSTIQEPDGLQGIVELFDDHNRMGVGQTDIIIEARAADDPKDETPDPASFSKKSIISKNQVGGKNEDRKKKRKTKKQQIHSATDLPEVQEKEKEQDVGSQIHVPSNDVKLVDFSSKKAKERKSSKTRSLNPNLVPVEDTEDASAPMHTDLLSGNVECSQVSLHMVKGSNERTLEVGGNVNSCNSGFIEEDNQKEVSSESNRINFKDFFVNGRDGQGVKSTGEVVDNKLNKKKKSDGELKHKKHKGKLAIHSDNASPKSPSLLKVSENQRNLEKAQGDNSSPIELHGSSLNNDSSKPMSLSKKKLLKPCESGILLAPPNDSTMSNPEEARKSNVADASVFITPTGKNDKAFAKPAKSLESSKVSERTKKGSKHTPRNDLCPKFIRKAPGSHMGEVVNITKAKKSLIATSGAIFQDESSIGSLDDQSKVNSDATTRTPSDNLSSSDGEGSYSSEREEDGQKSSIQSRSAVPKNMTLDAILRSSSRYKKVRQSQPEDTESQLVDFVPDSQAEA